ncbi:hypothetical protein [Shewanella algae]|uniref:hypothetical protein n=1 Tax=Shewanella algae TaxID=38313 RepID=UPI0038B2FB1C
MKFTLTPPISVLGMLKGDNKVFESITSPKHQGFSYQFEKIRNAINPNNQNSNNKYAAINLGLDIIQEQFIKFKDELSDCDNLNDWEYDLETYFRAIDRLRDYWGRNQLSLNEHDAWVYYNYLNSTYNHFCKIAEEISHDLAQKD